VLERVSFIIIFGAIYALCNWCLPRPAVAEIMCADDTVPEGMIVAATGTAATCSGACRARELKPACGRILKICGDQPVPKGYVLDSITTMPACSCVGTEDNAYVIRYVGTSSETVVPDESELSADDGLQAGEQSFLYSDDQETARMSRKERYPYGDPPFGNVLCATAATRRQPEPYGRPLQSMPSQQRGPNQSGLQAPGTPSASWPAPQESLEWNDQQSEPFRVGQ